MILRRDGWWNTSVKQNLFRILGGFGILVIPAILLYDELNRAVNLRLTPVKEDTNFDHTVKIIDHLATRFLNSEKLMILSTSYNTEPNLDPCCCDIFWKITVYIANKSSERRTITWTWGGVYNIRAQLIVFAFILNYVLLYNMIGLTTSMWREGSVRNRQEIARINVRNEEKITENEYLTFGDTVDAT